jgi:PAS domain S-box-containing protein
MMQNIFDLLSNTSDAAVAIDAAQRIIFWNEAAERLFGFKPPEVYGRFCHDVVVGRDESCYPRCQRSCFTHAMALRQQRVPAHEFVVHTKAGRQLWVSCSTIVVPSRWSDRCVLIHLFRDVSRQKAMEHFVQQLLSNVAQFSIALGTETQESLPLASPSAKLTSREREVLGLLVLGTSTRAIATKLFISPSTARNHIHNILTKLGVHSRLEATLLALKNRLM